MTSEITITRSRINTPRRRGDIVTRPRLISMLNELVEKRLILVSAPAGYGKTSLLIDFANQSSMPVCWYSIDALDFDPVRFISYFVAAIQCRFPEFGNRANAILKGSKDDLNIDFAVSAIIEDLYENVPEYFLLILDDFHLINESLPVRKFFNKFLQDVDENCHVLISSRSLLSLSVLPILASRSEVDGLSYEELTFQPDEIQQFYEQNHQQLLPQETAVQIQQQTEGWITGVILASQINPQQSAARARLSRVSGFGLEEYFLQIIDQLPADLRSFLLRSSLLEEFNAESCSRIIGTSLHLNDPPWEAWMAAVQENNLFALSVGEQGDWLRYHPLFLDFLQNRIFRERPQEAQDIEHRLALDCEKNQEWDRAFSIYRRLGAFDDLISFIETAGMDLLASGRISTLSAWIDVIPAEMETDHPLIIALKGKVAFSTGDTHFALSLYDQALNSMQLPDDNSAYAQTLAWRGNLRRLMGQLDPAIQDAYKSLSLTGNNANLRKVRGEALRCIGLCRYQMGNLQEALNQLKEAQMVMRSIKDHRNEAEIMMEIGIIYENLGQYPRSREHYLASLHYWKQVENPINLSILHNNLGVLQHLMGDYEQSIASFNQALHFSRANSYSRIEGYALTGIADIFTELQADEQAERSYIKAAEIADHIEEHFLQVYIKVKMAALAGLRGDISTAYQFIQNARDLVGQNGSEMESALCDLEFAGLKIYENRGEEIIPILEKACAFFKKEGHRIQQDKAHFYLILAYQNSPQKEKTLGHELQVLATLGNEFPPVSLIAIAARYHTLINPSKIEYLQPEMDDFYRKIDKFVEKLPTLRRYLRENSQTDETIPPVYLIRALGRMQVLINDQLVSSSEWQTQAARDLFFMLLANPEGMTKEEIALIFWPDASIEEAKFRFKNTIYRLRRAVGKNCILLEQDIYRFNNGLDYEYDVEIFLKENALSGNIEDPLKKLAHLHKALKAYSGKYLSEIEETWAVNHRECLNQNYLSILLQVTEIYLNMRNYDLAMQYCQQALHEDNLSEDAYRLSLRILSAMGNRAAMVRQYQHCVDVLEKEINALPSPKTQTLYQDLLR